MTPDFPFQDKRGRRSTASKKGKGKGAKKGGYDTSFVLSEEDEVASQTMGSQPDASQPQSQGSQSQKRKRGRPRKDPSSSSAKKKRKEDNQYLVFYNVISDGKNL